MLKDRIMKQEKSTAKRKYLVLVLIGYVLICSIAAVYSYLKFKSLNFHPRDFPFYLQFAAKLGDQNLTNQYSLNPDGHNFIGFYGTEAEDNFHQALHLEPVKYLYPLFYKVFKAPGLFLFSALIFFSPMVYFAFIHFKTRENSHWIVLFFTILYIFTTLSLEAASLDLRPFAFLGPVFVMLIFSIHFDRPLWEKILFFNCLLLIREEAMILTFGVLLYTAAKEYSQSKKLYLAKIFTVNWLVWVGLVFLYYGWTGYAFINYVSHLQGITRGKFIPAGIGFVLLFALIYLCLFIIKKRNQQLFSSLFMLLTYSLIFIPVFMAFFPLFSFSNLGYFFILFHESPRFNILFITFLVFLVLVWDLFLRNRGEIVLKSITVIIMGYFIFTTGQATYARFRKYAAGGKQAEIVFSIRENTDKYKTGILCDYNTYQAFYDYENVFCFNRLPSYMISGADRYYPDNIEVLKQLIKEKVDYVVLALKGKEIAANRKISNILNLNKIPAYASNEKYIIYKIQRKIK
jgi:hypothetical protein